MGHDKLRKFAENATFSCLLQPSAQELLKDGYFSLNDHPVKGHWAEKMFAAAGEDDAQGGQTERPIVLELGCGKGEYTIDLAQRNPGRNYIGVDIKGARLWRGAKHATVEGMKNVAFLRTRIEFIKAFFAPGEVSEVWLTFSDPQMKSENSRLTSPMFLDRYRSFLKPGGIVHLKTDSRFLYEYTMAVVRRNGLRLLAATPDLYALQEEGAECAGVTGREYILGHPELFEVQTFYERMFRQQGYKITYLSFVIDHDGAFEYPADPEEFDSAYWRETEGPRHFAQPK